MLQRLREAWTEAKDNPERGEIWAYDMSDPQAMYSTDREFQVFLSPSNYALGIGRETDGPRETWTYGNDGKSRWKVQCYQRDTFWHIQIGPIQFVYSAQQKLPMVAELTH